MIAKVRRYCTSSVAAWAALAGSAHAADLPTKAPAYIPAPAPALVWTGLYVGANAGGYWSDRSVDLATAPTFVSPDGGLAAISPARTAGFGGLTAIGPATAAAIGATGGFDAKQKGFIGGGQIGYNWQTSSFVSGLEADLQGLTNSDSGNAFTTSVPITAGGFVPGFNSVQTIAVDRKLDYLGTVRGRVGFIVAPTFLVYGTGGLAYGGTKSDIGISGAGVSSPTPFSAYLGGASFSDTRVGWTAGVGLEWMFAPNWSAKVEYLHYDLGSVSYLFQTNVLAGPGVVPAGTLAYTNTTSASTRFDGDIMRVGINWHFNTASPLPSY